MRIVINPLRETWKALLQRPVQHLEQIEEIVRPVMEAVRTRGDEALVEFTEQFDGVKLNSLKVTQTEIETAITLVPEALKSAIQIARENIEKFHREQQTQDLSVETMPGVICSRKSLPIQKVGLYIPGGTAPLFSTVLMLGVPARIAGCQQIVLCTPPEKNGKVNPAILYTAQLLGVHEIYKIGGAQAIAGMTFGTETVPQVFKIFGPGNQYVTAAKQLATKYGIAIDMPAGPSELAVYADDTAIPAFVAADLISQAEHGEDSQVLLISSSQVTLDAVTMEVAAQLDQLPRRQVAQSALENSLTILIKENEAIELINEYGPEHLILAVNDARVMADQIKNAGSVFIGNYTPESAGDYASGTNHTLPTNGFAKAFDGVSVDSFVKKITYQEINEAGLKVLGPVIETMAAAEQLDGHKNAVSIRLKYLQDV